MKKRSISIIYMVVWTTITLFSCDKYEDYDLDPEQPVAVFNIKEHNGYVVTMSNTSQNAASYLWDFGDGNFVTEKEPTYTYELPGDWKITFMAFSKGRIKADLDSIRIAVEGFTGDAGNFVGTYKGEFKSGDQAALPFTTTTTAVEGENAIMFGNLLKANRLQYDSWGFHYSNTTDDYAKLILKEGGIIEIPQQYMYHINGNGFVADVYIQGRGRYNAETGALSLEYAELFNSGDPPVWDGETITERVIIARKQ